MFVCANASLCLSDLVSFPLQGSEVNSTGHVTLAAPLSTIPLHVRGGSILPIQDPALTTTDRYIYNLATSTRICYVRSFLLQS